MDLLLLAKGFLGAAAGSGFVFLTIDHNGRQIQLTKNKRLINKGNSRSENIYKVCDENNENSCKVEKSYIPQYEDEEKGEFLYHEANFDYLLSKTKPTTETGGSQLEEEQINKIKANSSNLYGVLDSVDKNRRDRKQYEEFGDVEGKRFRKLCMIMLEETGEVTVNPSTSGILCVMDEGTQEDFKKYKEEKDKNPSDDNGSIYLRSVTKSKKTKE